MARIQSFRDLDVWQKGDLVVGRVAWPLVAGRSCWSLVESRPAAGGTSS